MLMSSHWIECTYYIESTTDLHAAAAELAGEQTSGTFVKVPGESDELAERFGGRVLSTESFGRISPSLNTRFRTEEVEAGKVRIAFPTENIGGDLTTLLTTVAGNLYELGHLTACRLVDIELQEDFSTQFPGPEFGVEGTRDAVKVASGPLIGTIVKPNIGLAGEGFRAVVRSLLESGLDFIKDDEINSDPTCLPFDRRVEIVAQETDRAADRFGRRIPYAFNVAGPISDLERKHALVMESGGQCVMLPVLHQGIASLQFLRDLGGLQLHAHRAGFAAISRSDVLGIDFTVWQKLLQLAGADHIHASGLQSKFFETDETVASNVRAILSGVSDSHRHSLPVLSSGQTVFAAQPTFGLVGSSDVMMLAGGGIIGHPLGAEAGVRSLRQAWKAAEQGQSLDEIGRKMADSGDLAVTRAIEAFGAAR